MATGMANVASPEYSKCVVGWIPQLWTHIETDTVSLKYGEKAYFYILFNHVANAATLVFILHAGATVATATNAVLLGNWWIRESTTANIGASDTLVKGAVGAAAITTTTLYDGLIVIEVEPGDYLAAGYDCFSVHMDAGEGSQLVSCMIQVVPGRYQQATPPSVIID